MSTALDPLTPRGVSLLRALYNRLKGPRVLIGAGVCALVGIGVALLIAGVIPIPFRNDNGTEMLQAPGAVTGQAPTKGAASPLYCGGTDKPFVALSFDDGPGPRTRGTVDVLRRAGERATFFLIGRNAQSQPDAAKNELQVGEVGDHTWSHPDLVRLPQDRLVDELARTQTLLQQQTDRRVTLLRPPEGPYNQSVVNEAQNLGMRVVIWNTDSRDSEGAPAPKIVQNVEAGLKPGSIIILHENKPETQKALPQILQAVKDRHLTSVSVPELLALDPPTPQQLQHGPRDCPLPTTPRKPHAT